MVVRARTPQLLGCLTKKMAARVDGVSVQLPGHPERRKPSGVDLAHGEGARIRRAGPAARQNRGVDSRRKQEGKELQVIMRTG